MKIPHKKKSKTRDMGLYGGQLISVLLDELTPVPKESQVKKLDTSGHSTELSEWPQCSCFLNSIPVLLSPY